MKVFGYDIPVPVELACEDRMRSGELFTCSTIEELAHKLGAPLSRSNDPIAYRFADRLIQRERKAGRIKRIGRSWVAK